MLSLFKPRDYAAVRIRTSILEPEIRRGAVAFLGEPGYRWEGLYSFAHDGRHAGDIRRVMWQGSHFLVRFDRRPDRRPDRGDQISRDELIGLAPRRVVGVANPYDPEFFDFLAERFGEAVS